MSQVRYSFLIAFILVGVSYTGAQVRFYEGKRQCDARNNLERSLLNAVNNGRESEVRQLLAKGGDAKMKDDCGNSALIYATAGSRSGIMRLLILAGADVNARGSFKNGFPLDSALDIIDPQDRYAAVKVLIDSGANVDVGNTRTPLMQAVLQEDVSLVELLIASGAGVNFHDEDRNSAYSTAASLGNQRLREILLAAGADPALGVPKYRKVYGEHAFFQAAADGRVDVVESMLRMGMASVNMTNDRKVTALMRAHDGPMVDALLSAGADVNLQDDRGFSALMWVAELGRANLVKKLIAAGADVNLRQKDGKALIDLVNRGSEIEKLIIEAGTNRQKPPI